jgi:acid phosphatase family membrane protein YuiD
VADARRMTPPDRPLPPSLSSAALSSADPPVLRVRDQGELLAAIPALIGFHPRESLVLVATGGESGHRLGLTLRVDLPPPEHVEPIGAGAVRGLLLDAPAGAAVLVVGERRGADPPHAQLVDVVVRGLEEHDVDVHTVLWAESTAAGARWACYRPCGCAGVVPDPSSTAFVAAAVAGGQVVHTDRAALERLVAPADAQRIRRREVQLIRAIDEELHAGSDPAGGDPEPGDHAAAVALIDAAVDDAGAGRLVLDDARVVALATALAVPAVRDAALLRCAGARAAAAEQLWTALVRETPDPEAAEPAALLAVSALLRGDGALANIALDRAERAWPGHRLSGLLRAAADGGMRPEQVRAWLQSSGDAPQDAARARVLPRKRRITRSRRPA